jgi:hypothetical protein
MLICYAAFVSEELEEELSFLEEDSALAGGLLSDLVSVLGAESVELLEDEVAVPFFFPLLPLP